MDSAASRSALYPTPGIFRWRQRRWWGWCCTQMYVLGIVSGGVSSGHPDGWIRRNFWRGERPYILGFQKHTWGRWPLWHRVRFGHWPETVWMGLCGICAPWPCCGATGMEHAEGCDGEF